jgi:SAM-dependent methyltransferase
MDLPIEFLERSLIKSGLKKRNLLKDPYLEVGCGDGFNLEEFSKIGMSGAVIDTSIEAIRIVKSKNLRGVEPICADFMTYDNYRSYPKVILILNVLEHIGDDNCFIEKAMELLSHGGFLIISVPARSRSYGFADANAGHIRRYDENELREKIERYGFTIDEWLDVGFPINRSYTWAFNYLNRKRPKVPIEAQTKISGIRNKTGYYPGKFDFIAKIAFPILKILIQIDRLFIRSGLGNNFIVFAKKD